jgi:hypothetical protein
LYGARRSRDRGYGSEEVIRGLLEVARIIRNGAYASEAGIDRTGDVRFSIAARVARGERSADSRGRSRFVRSGMSKQHASSASALKVAKRRVIAIVISNLHFYRVRYNGAGAE